MPQTVTQDTKPLTVLIPMKTKDAIQKVAKRNETSVAEWMRGLIKEGLKADKVNRKEARDIAKVTPKATPKATAKIAKTTRTSKTRKAS